MAHLRWLHRLCLFEQLQAEVERLRKELQRYQTLQDRRQRSGGLYD